MPGTINGIGTTYFGKKNLETHPGICESCRRTANLSDYETGYYFCILFIPIIPLGRRMILDQCPMCTRHKAVPLKEWEAMKEQSISSGLDALTENAEDPVKALELLGTFTAFKQYNEAQELACATANSHPTDYDTQLALGAWFEDMQLSEEAEKCFQRCLEIDSDCIASKRIRAIAHIENNELPQARTLAVDIFSEQPLEQLVPMFALASAYEQAGQHSEAYAIYQLMAEAVPQLKEDRDFCKDVRSLEKKLGVTDSIAPKKGLFGMFG